MSVNLSNEWLSRRISEIIFKFFLAVFQNFLVRCSLSLTLGAGGRLWVALERSEQK
jgi:hypothetical protein